MYNVFNNFHILPTQRSIIILSLLITQPIKGSQRGSYRRDRGGTSSLRTRHSLSVLHRSILPLDGQFKHFAKAHNLCALFTSGLPPFRGPVKRQRRVDPVEKTLHKHKYFYTTLCNGQSSSYRTVFGMKLEILNKIWRNITNIHLQGIV